MEACRVLLVRTAGTAIVFRRAVSTSFSDIRKLERLAAWHTKKSNLEGPPARSPGLTDFPVPLLPGPRRPVRNFEVWAWRCATTITPSKGTRKVFITYGQITPVILIDRPASKFVIRNLAVFRPSGFFASTIGQARPRLVDPLPPLSAKCLASACRLECRVSPPRAQGVRSCVGKHVQCVHRQFRLGEDVSGSADATADRSATRKAGVSVTQDVRPRGALKKRIFSYAKTAAWSI